MTILIVRSEFSAQAVKDALMRAIFNLRKHKLSGYDDEQADILEAISILEVHNHDQHKSKVTRD